MTATAHPTSDWDGVRQCLDPTDEPYFRRDYHVLHQGTGTPAAWQAGRGTDCLFVPGLQAVLGDSGRWDLESGNGYGGPLAPAAWRPPEVAAAWHDLRRTMAAAGGVAAFFRLHPLLDQQRWLPADAVVRVDRPTVFVPTPDAELIWHQSSARHRNMVRKAEAGGLRVAWDDPGDWRAAADLYAAHMAALAAPDRLRFGVGTFSGLRDAGWASLAAVRDGEGLAAMAVFLWGSRWSHYHLAARRPDAGNQVGNLILQAGLMRTAELGLEGCHLGGGRTPATDDSLLRFKRSLGGHLLTFRTAGVVLDPRAYDMLEAAWRRRAGRDPVWFLGYRQPTDG